MVIVFVGIHIELCISKRYIYSSTLAYTDRFKYAIDNEHVNFLPLISKKLMVIRICNW